MGALGQSALLARAERTSRATRPRQADGGSSGYERCLGRPPPSVHHRGDGAPGVLCSQCRHPLDGRSTRHGILCDLRKRAHGLRQNAWLQRDLASIAGSPLDVAVAREAAVTPQGTRIYVVPTTAGGVCFVDSNVSENFCATESQMVSGAASAGNACSPTIGNTKVEIAGILPDGATHPTLALADGTSLPLAVAGNVCLVQLDRKSPLPTAVAWTSAGATQTADRNLPADAASINCAAGTVNTGTTAEREEVTVIHNKG